MKKISEAIEVWRAGESNPKKTFTILLEG